MLLFILFIIKTNNMNTETFIEKAKSFYGNKYDYSKVNYVNNKTKVCIICPIHGEFFVTPSNHISKHNHCGCPKCCGKYKTTESFINEAKKIHGDKYDYSKVEYKKWNEKVEIICPIHGNFFQTPNDHLNGRGCKQCGKDKLRKKFARTKEDFINLANNVHNNKYDYSKVEYVNCKTPVKIICPIHGEFLQIPDSHIQGKGCIQCSGYHKSVDEISSFLKNNGFNFEREKKFKWLKRQRLDFYLPDFNTAIEYQGEQHFSPVKYFGGDKRFNDRVERDKRKQILCKQNGVDILYISFWKNAPNDVIKSFDELLAQLNKLQKNV